ncbi:FHA domain-containing protein [Actinomadura rugatobispora]|uniref:FHA domain-containing protein n=1 Tax=Actinomadura rugatobispora TaxID=1994 RepID=A0ABW0ZYW6_9ACTN|nr:hypothetical protein GCM10010200_037910 [Actinomadura rugatobispora]
MSDGQGNPRDRRFRAGHPSLALGVPPSTPGTIYALTASGGIAVRPRDGRTLVFGRNLPDVHVCLGENDRRVSRRHGLLSRRDDRWWVRTTGRLPLRFPDSRLLFADDDPVPLTEGYTPLFVRGSSHREHLLELYVAGPGPEPEGRRPTARHGQATRPPQSWRLTDDERLVLVVLARRHLLHEPHPRPPTWKEACEILDGLQPGAGWTAKKVAHRVAAVRARLSEGGVPGLTREEVGEPVGNALNQNLILELVASSTLVPPDLLLLGVPAP